MLNRFRKQLVAALGLGAMLVAIPVMAQRTGNQSGQPKDDQSKDNQASGQGQTGTPAGPKPSRAQATGQPGNAGGTTRNRAGNSGPRTGQGLTQGEGNARHHDAMIAQWVILGNQREINLSQIGQQRAENADVRQFAQQMVQEHRQFIQQLQPFTNGQGVAGNQRNVDNQGTLETSFEQNEDPVEAVRNRNPRGTSGRSGNADRDNHSGSNQNYLNDNSSFNRGRRTYGNAANDGTSNSGNRSNQNDRSRSNDDQDDNSSSRRYSKDNDNNDNRDSSDDGSSCGQTTGGSGTTSGGTTSGGTSAQTGTASGQASGNGTITDQTGAAIGQTGKGAGSTRVRGGTQYGGQGGTNSKGPTGSRAQRTGARGGASDNLTDDDTSDSLDSSDTSNNSGTTGTTGTRNRNRSSTSRNGPLDDGAAVNSFRNPDIDVSRGRRQGTDTVDPLGTGDNVDYLGLQRELGQQYITATRRELERLRGGDFDQAFMRNQVYAHQEMIGTLEVLSKRASPQLQQVLQQGLESSQHHLEEAQEILAQLVGTNYRNR